MALGTVQVIAWLALAGQGVHFSGQVQFRNQARAGVIQTEGLSPSRNLSISEIALPSAQGKLKFGQHQEVFVRYRPQFLNTYRLTLPQTPLQPGAWAGWTTLQRLLLTYKTGQERQLEFYGQANVSAGKLDTGNPDLVQESGFLPGALGQLVTYLNANAILQAKRTFGRSFRLLSVQTLSYIQYQVNGASGYFSSMPEIGSSQAEGNQSQFKLIAHQELEYIFDHKNSFFAGLDYSDVSYETTASFPAVTPTLGYGHRGAGPSQLKARLGFIRYWTNPFPGVFERPGMFPVADLTVSRTFGDIGLPRLKINGLVGLAPYYNLLFLSLEPRTTVLLQLQYSVLRDLDVRGSFRFLSSRYFNLQHWNQLQHGHPRNIILGSVGVVYHWRKILQVDLTGYGSEQTYEFSTTQGYTVLRQVYVLLGLQGTWQRR